MFSIDPRPFGYHLTFSHLIHADEMQDWLEKSRATLASATPAFGVLVDMRALRPLPAGAQAALEAGQRLYRRSGMQRSALLVESPVTKMQFIRIARDTGIDALERYIDASAHDDPHAIALDWIENAVDPDRNAASVA